MMRLLFWIALIVLIVAAVRSKLRAAGPHAPAARSGPAKPAAAEESETMACCAQCGVYFPASESVRVNGRDYCSPAHLPPP